MLNKLKIMQKRAEKQRSTSQSQISEDETQESHNSNYGMYFDYLGGRKTHLFDD